MEKSLIVYASSSSSSSSSSVHHSINILYILYDSFLLHTQLGFKQKCYHGHVHVTAKSYMRFSSYAYTARKRTDPSLWTSFCDIALRSFVCTYTKFSKEFVFLECCNTFDLVDFEVYMKKIKFLRQNRWSMACQA